MSTPTFKARLARLEARRPKGPDPRLNWGLPRFENTPEGCRAWEQWAAAGAPLLDRRGAA